MPTVTERFVYPTFEELIDLGEISPETAHIIGETATHAVSFGSTQHDNLSEELKAHVWRVDDDSLAEVSEAKGFVYYHRGAGQTAFSACFWRTLADAAHAMHTPTHINEAIPLARSGIVYKHWELTQYSVAPDPQRGFRATRIIIPGHEQLHS